MKDYISFDLETTGTDVEQDRIVSIGIAEYSDRRLTSLTSTICNPTVTMTPENIAVHGITNEEAARHRTFAEIAPAIHETISASRIITGFNIKRFDVPMLYTEFARCGIDWDWRQHIFIDSCLLYHKREPRNLDAAIRFYFGEERGESHDSEADAKDAGRLIAEQINTYNLGGLSPEELAKETDGDQEYLDISRKIKLHQGVPVFAFGKWKDEPLTAHTDYARWMLSQGSFTADTKRVILDHLPQEHLSYE